MAEYNEKVNNGTEDRSKKTVISAVVAVAAAIAVATVILIAKEPIFLSVSRSLAANHSYDAAEFFVQLCSSDEADILDEYIDLRQDINGKYGLMVSDFDRVGIEEWQKSAEKVSNNIGAVGEKLEPEALALSEALDKICKLLNDYDDLRPEIMELFEVFNEINRLYARDEAGESTVFTISQEIDMLNSWKRTANRLEQFRSEFETGTKTYLLTYFLKEAQGEEADLREAMNSFVLQGYDSEAQIRVKGATMRTFPSIRNGSGITVNLQEKDVYEKYMYRDLCSALAETLGEFYIT